MSVSTINIIADRVSVATKESPIAIFKVACTKADHKFDAVFGSTVATQLRIDGGNPAFVGLFTRDISKKELTHKLISIANAA